MVDGIKISTQVLVDTASKIRTINENLDSKLADINKEMNNLENYYRSDSGTEIRAAMNGMKTSFAQYKEVVNIYAKFLDDSARQYEETETTNQNNASQFRK
ncbi:MAG: WXG100 family type VII secretion target [Erysipelotrichaceae bacterium]|jgi:WXG100 family type VII secretion target|nr:WXG100 family type VII secretion target [Erysipelotrichaceae bacterium]